MEKNGDLQAAIERTYIKLINSKVRFDEIKREILQRHHLETQELLKIHIDMLQTFATGLIHWR